MRVSLNWLNEYIDLSDLSIDDLADKLNLSGTAIESIESPGKGLDKIIVGEVKEISPHPNADKLSLVKASVGTEILDIVCGAKNFKVGDKVPVALVGAVMPSGMEIKPAKLRGEKSNGMLCSERELNIGEGHSGIMILPEDFTVGEPIVKALGLDDYILDLEITPNRPDCMSVVGIARECAAVLGRFYRYPDVELRGTRHEAKDAKDLVSVEIKDTDLCPRYTAKVISNVKIGPSPDWMQQRLIAAGARPINNLVDITNYVLFELGQPLHAFDYDLIPDGKIIVRRALKDEKIVTLDDIERELLPETLVIADKNTPIALAGVMGGAGSEVNDNTKTVLLESAFFDSKNISRTSRELGLIFESSMRFERGVDPNGLIFASERACYLFQEIAGGEVLSGVVDEYPDKINPVTIDLRTERVNKILGTDLNKNTITQTLESLELKVSPCHSELSEESHLNVEVPTFRPDLEREIDLIEEIARLYGLNNIESTLPLSREKQGKLTDIQKNQQQVRDLLVGSGYFETLNYGFTDGELIKTLNLKGDVEITNPIASDLSVLRPSLIPGLMKNAINNIRYGNEALKLFEIGYAFKKSEGDVPKEIKRLALLVSGDLTENSWSGKPQKADFYFLKGTLEALCGGLKIDNLYFTKEDHPTLESGQSAGIYFGEEKAGFIGAVSKEILEKLDLPENIYIAEIDYEPLIKYAKSRPEYIPISKYPGITLDVALLLYTDISNHEIEQVINETGEELLKEVKLFDLYTGKGIPAGKKSMAYSLYYQAFDRTLTTDETVALHNKVKKALVDELGAEIR